MRRLREFGESTVSAVLERVGRGVSRLQERTPLPADLLESDEAFLAVFDAPGAARSDVQVRFIDDEVQVRVERFRDFYQGFEMRFPGRGLSLDGSVSLPEDASVEAERASATLTERGTLEVRIPKSDVGQRVEVRDEADAEEVASGDAEVAPDAAVGDADE